MVSKESIFLSTGRSGRLPARLRLRRSRGFSRSEFLIRKQSLRHLVCRRESAGPNSLSKNGVYVTLSETDSRRASNSLSKTDSTAPCLRLTVLELRIPCQKTYSMAPCLLRNDFEVRIPCQKTYSTAPCLLLTVVEIRIPCQKTESTAPCLLQTDFEASKSEFLVKKRSLRHLVCY